MRICMVLEFFVPHYNGGGEHRYYEIAKRLVAQGHHVDVLNMKIQNVPDYENIDGINVHHIGPTISSPPKRSMFNFVQYFFSVIKWLLRYNYDIIDAQAYSPLLSSSLYSRFSKTPLVATIHDTSSSSGDQWIQSSQIASFMEKFLINLNFNRILTVSHATKNSLVEDFGVDESNIEILYNGVDIAKYDSVNVSEVVENRIIFVGRLIPHKHVDHLINIVSEIHGTLSSVNLMIVGKGEEKENLENLVKEKHLEDVITFKQNLSDEELIREIKKAEILVLPSTREGFGMVLTEANCCYKPVIAYASGGTVEVIEDGYNGFLIESGNQNVLEDKVNKLLLDTYLSQKMGENGRIKVEQVFDWDLIVEQYIKMIENIIQ